MLQICENVINSLLKNSKTYCDKYYIIARKSEPRKGRYDRQVNPGTSEELCVIIQQLQSGLLQSVHSYKVKY